MHLELALATLLAGSAGAGEAGQGRVLELEPPRPGLEGWVVLTGGRARAGRITAVDPRSISVEMDPETTLVLRADVVRGVLSRAAIGDELVPHGSLGGRSRIRVLSIDGRVREGRPVERTPAYVVVEVGPDLEERVESADILVVQTLRELQRPIEPRPRYLEAPSAWLPRRGEIHLADTQVAHLSGAYGIADWLTISAGSALPVLHAEPYGANAQTSLRAGLAPHDLLRLAGGLHLSGSARGGGALYASATATLGTARHHLSVHAGPTFPGANRLARVSEVGLALAGSVGLPRGFDLLAEGWLSRTRSGGDGLVMAAARARLGRAAVDLGLGSAVRRPGVFPWLGMTWDATP